MQWKVPSVPMITNLQFPSPDVDRTVPCCMQRNHIFCTATSPPLQVSQNTLQQVQQALVTVYQLFLLVSFQGTASLYHSVPLSGLRRFLLAQIYFIRRAKVIKLECSFGDSEQWEDFYPRRMERKRRRTQLSINKEEKSNC